MLIQEFRPFFIIFFCYAKSEKGQESIRSTKTAILAGLYCFFLASVRGCSNNFWAFFNRLFALSGAGVTYWDSRLQTVRSPPFPISMYISVQEGNVGPIIQDANIPDIRNEYLCRYATKIGRASSNQAGPDIILIPSCLSIKRPVYREKSRGTYLLIPCNSTSLSFRTGRK